MSQDRERASMPEGDLVRLALVTCGPQLEVALMTPVSHLWWGLWAVMQATTSAIDFDYLGYAAKRLEAFRETRTTSLERRVQVTS